MIYKYIYKNIVTGKKIYTNEKINKIDYKLIREVRGVDTILNKIQKNGQTIYDRTKNSRIS